MAASVTPAKTVIVVGSGGREHALAWKLAQSPEIRRLIVAPGNAGMPAAWERWPFSGKPAEFAEFAERARTEKADLVVVGPDNPLADGLVDVLARAGVAAFGPTASAARIEASKAFAKEVMQAAGVPTARHFVARTEEEARKLLKSIPWGAGWVIKADGLALGKGVRLCDTPEEATRAAVELIRVSGQLVIEERLRGEELSWLALCDGERCALLEPARDYKRALDGDRGLNTGGMGSYSPVPGVPEGMAERVRAEVFVPTLRELARRGAPFRGVLYAGLMVDAASGKYWVLEFNARFGDPETQVLMPRIEGDVLPWLEACARGSLGALGGSVPFARECAVYVVGASEGYPELPLKGQRISGLQAMPREAAPGFFVAGATQAPGSGGQNGEDGQLVVSGGRVLGALGMGDSLQAARAQAYSRLNAVSFEGMRYRSDIALTATAEAAAKEGRG